MTTGGIFSCVVACVRYAENSLESVRQGPLIAVISITPQLYPPKYHIFGYEAAAQEHIEGCYCVKIPVLKP